MKSVLPIILCYFVIFPSYAYAVEKLSWGTHGLMALSIATLVSIVLVARHKALTHWLGRILTFGLYFWVLIFFQAILYGIYYGFFR